MSGPQAYPLQWPPGWPRTPSHQRTRATFTTTRLNATPDDRRPRELTVAVAIERLQRQIDMLGARYAVVSSNIELRLDGLPRSGIEPSDPGVCLYFQLKGQATAMPCDRFHRAADNMAAIAAHIDAVRRIERYGVATTAQMFTGFQAIRGPGPKPWREVLGIREPERVDRDIIEKRRRALAAQHHPDVPGGNPELMSEINAAADRALQELAL